MGEVEDGALGCEEGGGVGCWARHVEVADLVGCGGGGAGEVAEGDELGCSRCCHVCSLKVILQRLADPLGLCDFLRDIASGGEVY